MGVRPILPATVPVKKIKGATRQHNVGMLGVNERLGPVYTKPQCQRGVKAVMTLVTELSLKSMETNTAAPELVLQPILDQIHSFQ